jgi:hypothetical protein
MHHRRIAARVVAAMLAGLVCTPAAVFAQTAPTQMAPSMLVERTPHYTLNLVIGPVEPTVSAMDAMHAQTGDVAMNGGGPMSHDMGMLSDQMDQGMAANHRLEVHITQGDSGSVVMDLTPTVRITNKLSGEARDLPQVMGMYGAAMGMSDFHYGQNVFLPDGTYVVKVLVGPDTAEFRDVLVAASPMMADHPMGTDASMAHDTAMGQDMSMAEGTARDGHMFSQESTETQALFKLVWGDRAAQEWVKQHNATLAA